MGSCGRAIMRVSSMNNVNKEPSEERAMSDRPTGWEEIAELADNMTHERQMSGAGGRSSVNEEISAHDKGSLLRRLREGVRLARGGYEVRNTGGDSKKGGVTIEARGGFLRRKIGAGVLTADLEDEEVAVLNAVHVDPRYRGRGVGSAITREAVAQAKREGLKRIKLNSTDMAVEMYKKQGFEMTDEDSGAMTLNLEGKKK